MKGHLIVLEGLDGSGKATQAGLLAQALEQQGLTFLSAEVDKIPQNTVAIDDPEVLKSIQKLLEMLDDNDDVQNVFHNAELPEEEDEE